MKTWFTAAVLVLAAAVLRAQPPPHPANAQILAAVQQISADTLLATIARMTQFHTRHTYSDTTSDSTGIGAAMRWLEAKASAYDSGGRFSFEWFPWTRTFQGNPVTRHNLVGRAGGTAAERARYIVGGHYDSRTVNGADNTGFAPGADDNGSACAALLELLRLLPDTLAHDLEVAWFTGEEQGLWGSAAYAQHLSQQGARVDGMVAMDMIGHIAAPGGGVDSLSVRLYAQGNWDEGGTASVSRNFQRYLKWVGEAYADGFEMVVIPATDRPGRGSDHVSFSAAGFPAVRVIERNEDLNYQHNVNDLPEHLSPSYVRRVAMATFGGLLTMLQAPVRPSAPLAEQIAADRVRITIPDTVSLPAAGGFYVSARNLLDAYFADVLELGTQRMVDYGVVPGEWYAFSISRSDAEGRPSPFSVETTIGILNAEYRKPWVPVEAGLRAAPNPFNAQVTIDVVLPQAAHATLKVYDLLGRHVAVLADGPRGAGIHRFHWSPAALPGGIYIVRLTAGQSPAALKVFYIR